MIQLNKGAIRILNLIAAGAIVSSAATAVPAMEEARFPVINKKNTATWSVAAVANPEASAGAQPRAESSDGGPDKKTDQPEPPRILSPTKRDPFRPFTTNTRPSIRRRENLTPLERYDLGQLKLVGVIWDVKEPNAIVEDSAGLGYVVRVGTPIGANDGKVKLIKPSEIIIEETHVDIYGAKKKRDVNMVLHEEKAQ
jgi:Tfp pilus assembly protein PilP